MVLFRMAVRNLLRQRRRTLLVLAALGLGVTALVGVRGFLNGLQRELVSGFTEGNIGAIQVHKKGFLQSLEAAPLPPTRGAPAAPLAWRGGAAGARGAPPRLVFPGLVSAGDESAFALIVAVDPVRELATCPKRSSFVVEGT